MCDNKVIQYVPKGLDYKAVVMKCGNTDIHGGTLLCDKPGCDNTNGHGQPWYICPHGNDVSEYDCGRCEME
jgi:hypothetical protein